MSVHPEFGRQGRIADQSGGGGKPGPLHQRTKPGWAPAKAKPSSVTFAIFEQLRKHEIGRFMGFRLRRTGRKNRQQARAERTSSAPGNGEEGCRGNRGIKKKRARLGGHRIGRSNNRWRRGDRISSSAALVAPKAEYSTTGLYGRRRDAGPFRLCGPAGERHRPKWLGSQTENGVGIAARPAPA